MADQNPEENSDNDNIIIPRMPSEFVFQSEPEQVADEFAIFKFDPNNKKERGCIMRIGDPNATGLHTMGDWMGYKGFKEPDSKKDDAQRAAEKIISRKLMALYPVSVTDLLILSRIVDIEKYDDYETEISSGKES